MRLGTMKSRAPSGVDFVEDRRLDLDEAAVLERLAEPLRHRGRAARARRGPRAGGCRRSDTACASSRRSRCPARPRTVASRDELSTSTRRDLDLDLARCPCWGSRCPRAGERTSPSTLMTHSGRTCSAVTNASPLLRDRTRTARRPMRSRRSTKIRPPWSRRLATQPASVDLRRRSRRRARSPQVCVRIE